MKMSLETILLIWILVLYTAIIVECLSAYLSVPAPKQGKRIGPDFIVCAKQPEDELLLLETIYFTLSSSIIKEGNQKLIAAISGPENRSNWNYPQIQFSQRLIVQSTSLNNKARQFNEAIKLSSDSLIVALDSDTHIHSIQIPRNCNLEEITFIQGAKRVRGAKTALQRMVRVEDEIKYEIYMPLRQAVGGFVYFCGSVAILSRKLLGEYRLDPEFLVEDIEVSTRLMVHGVQGTYTRTLEATELAPASLSAWWHQRVRWAQGWLEVFFAYAFLVIASPRVSFLKKVDFLYLCVVRRHSLMVAQIGLGLTMAFKGVGQSSHLLVMILAMYIVALVQVSTLALLGRVKDRLPVLQYFVLFPAYDLLKSAVVIGAFARILSGKRNWRVTKKSN